MSKTYVSELTAGQAVETDFAVLKKEILQFKDAAKGKFLALTLGDRTGRIEARKWDNVTGELPGLKTGGVVRIRGKVEDYRGELQVNVADLVPVAEAEIRPEEFLPVSARGIDEMKAELLAGLEEIPDSAVRTFLTEWFREEDFLRRYSLAPGAKMVHHAYLGGLMEHSLEVRRMALTMADLYPRVDRSLLAAGTLLHDVGKMEEYQYRTAIEISDRGRLLGHIPLGYEMVNQRAVLTNTLSESQRMHLGHIILSHHGDLEQGSPVVPQTLEAVIVHQADLASSRIRQYEQVMTETQGEGDWIFDRHLQHYLYRGFLTSQK